MDSTATNVSHQTKDLDSVTKSCRPQTANHESGATRRIVSSQR